ncbi:unnamed protein product [Larinioides sclopetarius]|uniref:Uncharacterized protein n=1 Tax=Larinioides sclopetarius TaxID=280406 RepID=A0AAV1Z595_9ARAC
MENRSFEGELPSGSPPKDPMNNRPGPSKPRADPSGDSKEETRESNPPLARITDDEDDESPPAYVRRYMKKEQKVDNFEDLEPPPPEPVQKPHDVRSDPEFQQQANRRRERRERQKLVKGPCSLRPEPSHIAPLLVPEPFDPDIGQHAANAPGLRQQPANAPDHEQQPANAPDHEQQPANAPDHEQQPANAPDHEQQPANVPDPGQQPASVPARSAIWDRCVSFYEQINAFTFQFPFHTLLLTWPLATAIMGILNLGLCKMNTYFPGVMIFVGLLGTIIVLLRLYAIYYEKRFAFIGRKFWIVIRTIESIIWILFAIQLYYFFEKNPSFTPGEKRYCKPKIYKINCGLMFLTSATMIGWMVVNIGNFIYCFPRRVRRL